MVTNIALSILAAFIFVDICAYFFGAGRFGWSWPLQAIKSRFTPAPPPYVSDAQWCDECGDYHA